MAVRIGWPEIRARAHDFVNEWRGETQERAEAQSFWNDFFYVFDLKRRHVAAFEKQVRRLSNLSGRGNIDCFWPGRLLIEHKSAGESLVSALDQATEYFDGLQPSEYPEVILACDFATFAYRNLESGDEKTFSLDELPNNLELFGFLAGYERQASTEELPVNRQAAELMGSVHDLLHSAGYRGHELEVLLMRLLFCLFAEDSSIFKPAAFYVLLSEKTKDDGSDFGLWLAELFNVLDTPDDQRSPSLDESLADFPYVNGGLFRERLPTAWFNRKLRKRLLEVSINFNWSQISPAVFGSLFQSIMDKKKRRDLGAHYTSERSIMRLVKSLFLDGLRNEFDDIIRRPLPTRRRKLSEFHQKLSSMRFLDPACGCGNFLVVAYRELRLLEFDLIKALMSAQSSSDQRVLDIELLIQVNVDQFGGIELEEWPARIAETALWLTDHQMNRKLEEIGQVFDRLPLTTSPQIITGNALRLDWNSIFDGVPLTYILGNPPFRGKQHHSNEQKEDMRVVFRGKPPGPLDYVTAWYRKAAEFIQATDIECAFVSTSSVAQGEQVAPLWNALRPFNIHINFAHQPFDWDSEGSGKAAVYVVIVGFAHRERAKKHVVVYDDVTQDGHRTECSFINAYLVPDGADVLVQNRRKPLCASPKILYGNMANEARPKGDTRPLFFLDSEVELESFVGREPKAENWIRPFIGADEVVNSTTRWCLWLKGAKPSDINAMPLVRARVRAIKQNRLKSTRPETKALAATPHLFGEIRQPTKPYLAIPRHSSERRSIIPFDYYDPKVIVGDACAFIEEATAFQFGVLQSAMHMAWATAVGGKLEGRYRYSNGLVYNAFPWPSDVSTNRGKRVEAAARDVLSTRAKYSDQSLGELYGDTMQPDLAAAHRRLNSAVDACYGITPRTLNDRLVFLFGQYAELIEDGQRVLKAPKKRRTRQSTKVSPAQAAA